MPLNSYFNILMVEVRSAKGLRDTDIGGKSDPYFKIKFDETDAEPHSAKGGVKKDTLNPVWNERHYFLVKDDCKHFKIELFDEDIGRDDSLGYANILRKEAGARSAYSGEDYYLEKGKGGTINVWTQEFDISGGYEYILKEREKDFKAFVASKSAEPLALLFIGVHSAAGLPSSMFDKADPYAKITFDGDSEGSSVIPKDLKTKTIDNNPNPVWNSYFAFFVPDALKSFRVTVWDEDVGKDDNIGHASIVLGGYLAKEEKKRLALSKKGEITLSYVKVPLTPLFSK